MRIPNGNITAPASNGRAYRRSPTKEATSLQVTKSQSKLQNGNTDLSGSRLASQSRYLYFGLAAVIWCFGNTTLLQRMSTHRNEQEAVLPPVEEKTKEIISVPPSWNSSAALEMLHKEFQPPFGFVMRDLARRVLSRHVANSNVLVIAPDAKEAYAAEIPAILDTIDFVSPFTLAGTFVMHANAEGHRTHPLNAGMQRNGSWTPWNVTLDQWWSSFDQESAARRPNWILLAVIDPGFGWEDVVWGDSQRFLEESTITYVVTAVRSRAFPNGTIEMKGLEATHALLQKRYKLQVLQVSHYHDDIPKLPTETLRFFNSYGPNALLKTVSSVESLLKWGAESARHYSNTSEAPVFTAYLFGTQGLDLAIPSRREYVPDHKRINGPESWTQVNLYEPVHFKPCPKVADRDFELLTFEKNNQRSGIHIKLIPEFSVVVRRKRRKSAFFRFVHDVWRFSWAAGAAALSPLSGDKNGANRGVRITPSHLSTKVQKPSANDRHLEPENKIWFDGNDPFSSEAACARIGDMVDCKTRIIPKGRLRLSSFNHSRLRKAAITDGAVPNGMDVLVIMLDPMSRGHLERSMPQTKSALQELGFLPFTQYSAVGDNSGPNQAALYSGKPLSDRDGISKKGQGGKSEWLWDTLREAGYVTLKGEDGCIENSNMLQSLKPDTTHGDALNEMFCFDFHRPNCLGPEPAASYLLQYGKQFIDTYANGQQGFGRPWAAFLHFVDSHEDTMTLSTMLDPLLAMFLRELSDSRKLENAIVMVISDHGLHYGPYFQTLSGRRERTEPLLYLKPPPLINVSSLGRALEENADLWTTPFDVHQTLIDVTVGRDNGDETESLLRPLPSARKTCLGTAAIPDRFCDLHDEFDKRKTSKADFCERAPRPPSILSFYADIPKEHRPFLQDQNCSETEAEPLKFENDCLCSTSHRDVYPCKEHPWGSAGINSTERKEEYFSMVKCDNRVEKLENRIIRQQRYLDRYQAAQKRRSNETQASPFVAKKVGDPKLLRPPDILVLEIDSVSVAHAERHLPLTTQFLKKYRLRRNGKGDIRCTDGVCALDFSRFAVVGPNSVVNQVAALSGCVVSRFHESCIRRTLQADECFDKGLVGTEDDCKPCPIGMFPIDPLMPCNITKAAFDQCCTNIFQPDLDPSRICRDDAFLEHELQLFRRGPRRHTTWCPPNPKGATNKASPWLFDVAKSSGYITYFGEEFCYDFSPYVTQDNTFPLETDYELRNLHCRLLNCPKCEGPWPSYGPHICLDHGDSGNPAFSQITALWDAYPDLPKFAFLNGMAAHDYNFEWIRMISGLEEYDAQLVRFLEGMISRTEFANTVIVVRTDHGMQGGPTTIDYSQQVEHREPWTQIIIPDTLPSLEHLANNQDRLATGYDLYHTIRNLMSSKDAAPIPSWTYDLFTSTIPSDRGCSEAKIPDDFCPCEGVGPDRAPHFGVCNAFEPYNDLFCVGNESIMPPEISL